MDNFDTLTHLKVKSDAGIMTITINRPKSLNALNHDVLKELNMVLDEFESAPAGFAVILTGAGTRAFVAGADVSEMAEMKPEEAREFSLFGQAAFAKLESLPVITIAAINGYAFGGGNELALACDIRIASGSAKFGQPEVGLGIIPGFGATQRLPRTVGKANALDLILSGRTIDAQEALRMGLIHRIASEAGALEDALAYARGLGKNSNFAVSKAKQAIAAFGTLSAQEGFEAEANLFSDCFKYPDQFEGMTAFVEKRRPVFK